MKSLKVISASLLALAIAGSAFAANTNLKMTGSTALRKATYAAIVRTLSAGGHTVRVVSCDPNFNNKAPDGAQQAVFVNDADDSVQMCLSGSVGGIETVVTGSDAATAIVTLGGDTSRAWLTAKSYASISSGAVIWPTVTVNAAGAFTYGAATGASVNVNSVAGNLGQQSSLAAYGSAGTPFDANSTCSAGASDSFQNSTAFDSVTWGSTLTDTPIGTIAFAFCKGAQHPSVSAASYGRLTNISTQNAQALANKGYVDLAVITGNSADAGIDVVLVGRNSDSGTRLGVFAETAIGAVTAGASQYYPVDANGADASQSTSLLTNHHFVPVANNQSGYDSGAFVKQTLTNPIAASGAYGPGGTTSGAGVHPFIEVAYVGAGDLAGVTLTYNGVALSQANIISGTYTLWTTGHILYDPAAIPVGAVRTMITSIASNITASNSNGNYVNVGGLNCHRTGTEGSTVLPGL